MNLTDICAIESALNGAMMDDPTAIDEAAVRLVTTSFFDDEQRQLFSALCDLRDAGLPTRETQVLLQELRQRKFFQKMKPGAIAYLVGNSYATRCLRGSVGHYCSEILRAAEHRRLLKVRDDFTSKLAEGCSPDETRDWLVAQVESGRMLTIADKPELIGDVVRRLADRPRDNACRIPSSINALNKLLGGYGPGQLILIAARPSIGKSAFAFQEAMSAAKYSLRTLFVSIEMPNDEIGARRIANGCDIQLADIMSGNLDPMKRRLITDLAHQMNDLPLLLWEPQSPTVDKIVAMIRREAAAGLRLAIIDYVSLIKHRDPKKPHWERIGEISKALKSVSKQLRLPIILLSQVGREVENRSGRDSEDGQGARRPTLTDLKYSGSLEEDADIVIFVHRATRMVAEAELIVAKHRNGPLKVIEASYDGPRFSFSETLGREFGA